MSKGEIYYLKKTEEGYVINRIEITDYDIPQLDRIEKKLDSIIKKIEEKELLDSAK